MAGLTHRQSRILMLLLAVRHIPESSAEGWLTSNQLAERLGVSNKLVKQEIAAIRHITQGSCIVQSNTRWGYRLSSITDKLSQNIVQHFDVHEGHHSITHRYACLYVFLLFQDKPISMSCLARLFYCSKTVIAEELEVMRRRVRRLGTLQLVVDPHCGVELIGSEAERRYEATKWLNPTFAAEIPFDEAVRTDLIDMIEQAQEIVERALADLIQTARISGEDIGRIARYCALCAWRSRAGYRMDSVEWNVTYAFDDQPECYSDAITLVEMMSSVFRYTFDSVEKCGLLSLMAICVISSIPSSCAELEISALADLAGAELGEKARQLILNREAHLSMHLDAMMARLGARHSTLNYQASLTMARYPLESYLALRFITAHGAFSTAKTEAARLALMLADTLEPLKAPARAVVFSSESIPVAEHVAHCIATSFSAFFARVDVVPLVEGEQALPKAIQADAMPVCIFTTDAALTARIPTAIVMSSLPSAQEIYAVQAVVYAWLDNQLQRLSAVYWHERKEDAQAAQELQQFLHTCEESKTLVGTWRHVAQTAVITVYHSVVLMQHIADNPCCAEVWKPEPDMILNGKHYDRVIEVTWDRADDLAVFLAAISRQLGQ